MAEFLAENWKGLLVMLGVAFVVWVAWCCLHAYMMGGVIGSAAARFGKGQKEERHG